MKTLGKGRTRWWKQIDEGEEVRRGKVSREVAREEDGRSDRGEMRGAIARWTPEGRVYFDNR